MVALSAIMFVVVSNSTPPPSAEKIAQYTFRSDMVAEGMQGLPWYQDYRFYAGLLVVVIGWIIVAFW